MIQLQNKEQQKFQDEYYLIDDLEHMDNCERINPLYLFAVIIFIILIIAL